MKSRPLRRQSFREEERPAPVAGCLESLRRENVLVVWKLDRLSRDLRHLVNIVHDLSELKALTGQGAGIDTTASGKLVFGIFAALAKFERELISERTTPGLAAARGRSAGRPHKLTPAKLRLAMAFMGKPGTKVSDLCTELGITRQTLYRLVHLLGNCAPTVIGVFPGNWSVRTLSPLGVLPGR